MNTSEKNKIIGGAVQTVLKKALASSFSSKRGRIFFKNAATYFKSASQRRAEFEQKGLHVPPFLIASITSECNLRCSGCYARAGGNCESRSDSVTGPSADSDKLFKSVPIGEMSPLQWKNVFLQASDLGVSFIILVGGEPLMRPEILIKASEIPSIIFPVFTNGTLFDSERIEFFDRFRNLIPVLSLEGDKSMTDSRRSDGVFDQIQKTFRELNSKNILFGVSVTVTTENMDYVTDSNFVSSLKQSGCTALFYVEYVPVDGNLSLAPNDADFNKIGRRVSNLRDEFGGMIIVSFPGDEQYLGGCLAAGIGFFHINAVGGAEPCPFSPYSDISLKTHSLEEAIQSPLFKKITAEGLLNEKHIGGCTLFAEKETVELFTSELKILK